MGKQRRFPSSWELAPLQAAKPPPQKNLSLSACPFDELLGQATGFYEEAH